jgi:hypothetical protein
VRAASETPGSEARLVAFVTTGRTPAFSDAEGEFLAGQRIDACRDERLVHAAVLNAAAMTRNAAQAPSLFTAPERDLIRREFALHFGAFPSLADGIFLRTWRTGPQPGQPKLPPAVRSMLERGPGRDPVGRSAPFAFRGLHRGWVGSVTRAG